MAIDQNIHDDDMSPGGDDASRSRMSSTGRQRGRSERQSTAAAVGVVNGLPSAREVRRLGIVPEPTDILPIVETVDDNDTGSGSVSASRKRNFLAPLTILVLLAAVYLLINQVLPGRISGFASSYVVQPLLWCTLAFAVLAVRRAQRAKTDFAPSALWIGLLLGAFHVAVLLIAALFTESGFGGSPYAHSIRYLFLNTVFFGTAVVGLEFSRAHLLSSFSKRHTTAVLFVTALLYTFLMVPLVQLTHLTDSFPFVDGNYLPLLAQNMVASSLALIGGPVSSIAYWGILKAFEWYSPILTDLPWILNAFAGTLAGVIGLLVLQSLYGPKPEPAEAKTKSSSPVGWVVVGIASVVIIFVVFGALGFRPTLVGSGSMRPALDVGDIVVVTAVSAEAVGEGDIIQFGEGGTSTIHRVVEVQENGSRVFITQGDANDSPDLDPVEAEQIQGRVKFRIPKVGWVAIWIKSLLS